jgi:hypothetical protein
VNSRVITPLSANNRIAGSRGRNAKTQAETSHEPLERCRIRDRLDDWQRVIADGRPTE